MKIAVNTRLLIRNRLEGIGWFTFETLKRITLNHPEHEFIFLFDRPYNREFIFADNVTPVVIHIQARHPVLWYLFFEWGVARTLKKYKADLFLSTDGWVSLKTKVPTINVIHDLNFVHYPEFIKPLVRLYYKKYFKLFAQKPIRLATVSEYTKNDIIKNYGVDAEKIDVVYNGSSSLYTPLTEKKKKEIKEQFSGDAPYFIYIGAIHYRKNLTGLFKAFDLFKSRNQTNHKLVIVGAKKWWKGEIEKVYNDMLFNEDVIFLGRLETLELNHVLSSAEALMYISFFEGFGIPIIEAFNAGTPVITSNTTSMPEVAGDAAEYVDPFSIESITEAMEKVATNKNHRLELIKKGFKQKEKFSWDITAQKLWNTIEKGMAEVVQ